MSRTFASKSVTPSPEGTRPARGCGLPFTRLGQRKESGIALIVVLGLMLILSLMMLGFYFLVTGEQKIAISNRDNTVAFYGAEAGLEKMSADIASLFANNASPSQAQILAVGGPANEPVIPNVTYPSGGYTVSFPSGSLQSTSGTIGGSGPLAGLQGVITPIVLTVVADGPNNTEVKLTRQVQAVAVPVFEFGIFSDTDLSFFAGPNFSFGGRVHTNGNLFLAEGNGNTLAMGDKVSAYGDIVRTQLSNGYPLGGARGYGTYNGTVEVITTAGGCAGWPPPPPSTTCRALAQTEGSVQGGVGSAPTPNWVSTISTTAYNNNLKAGNYDGVNTGNGTVKQLEMDLTVGPSGSSPIEIIRRALPGDSALVSQERFFNKASLRILLSDDPSLLPNTGSNAIVPLGIDSSYAPNDAAHPVLNSTLASPWGVGKPNAFGYVVDPCHPPLGVTPSSGTDLADFTNPAGTPEIGGYIEIDMNTSNDPVNSPLWKPVTTEILNQGITGTAGSSCTTGGKTFYPILHLEKVDNVSHTTTVLLAGPPPVYTPGDYIPISLYDSREGQFRDLAAGNPGQISPNTITLNGVMNIIELDVGNLRKWFNCDTGISPCSGTQIPESASGGYIVYFSDRRGNHMGGGPQSPCTAAYPKFSGCPETGEYGNEDIVNSSSSTGMPDGVQENAEDVDQPVPKPSGYTPTFYTYGAKPLPPTGAVAPLNTAATPQSSVGPAVAQKNPVIFFRRALRLMDARLGLLPPEAASNCTLGAGYGGFTVAAENPIYIWGDYNADNTQGLGVFNDDVAAGKCHVPASVIADAVTLLSNNWNDSNSFSSPLSPSGRAATASSYRTAIIGGKNVSFPWPSYITNPPYSGGQDFGTDGGVHNFLRYLENWGGVALSYRGSLVSFYFSRQATGVYKCCTTVYGPPNRGYAFDTDFLSITTLPPGTPRFTDVNALSFEQSLLPTQ
jgi:hypothetical protein